MSATEEAPQAPPSAPRERRSLGKRFSDFVESLGPAGLLPLIVLFGLNMVDEFDRVAFGSLAPEIRDAFGLSSADFIFVVTLSGGLSVLLAVPIGYLGDRYNRVMLSRAAGLVWAITAVLTGLAPALVVLLVVRFANGVGRLVNEPVHPSLLSDYYPQSQLPRIFAIHRFANSAGLIAGPIAGVLTTAFGSWRPTFVILALPTLILIALAGLIKEPTRGASAGIAEGERVPLRQAFRKLRGIRTLRRTWLAAFFFGSGVIPFAGFLSLFFEDIYKVGPIGRGWLQGIFGVGGAVGLFVGGRLGRRAFSRGQPELIPVYIGVMIVEFAVFTALMAVSPWMIVSAMCAVIAAVGFAGFLPPYLTAVALAVPPRIRSQAYSYSLLFFALGGIILSRISAGIGDAQGLRVGLIVLSVFVALGGLIGSTTRRFIKHDIETAFAPEPEPETA